MSVQALATETKPQINIFKLLPARADLIPHGEKVLPMLWDRLHAEGTFEMFFHDCPNLEFGAFVAALSRPDEQVHVVCLMDSDAEDAQVIDCAGIAMVTDIRFTEKVKRGLGNFILMQRFWGAADAQRIGQVILDGWFRELTVIAGITPSTNERALRFVEHLGFRVTGTLPQFVSYRGQVCDAVITAQTRHQWLDRREELNA